MPSELGFTPGPWRVYQGWVHPCFDHPSPQGTNGDTAICEPLGPDAKANAQLIAAAPELLEALKLVLRRIKARPQTDWLTTHGALSEIIEAAIAKAEGRSNNQCKP